MEVQISKGLIILKKPTAGARNKALAIAETVDGIKNTVLLVELLPYCIQSHPFQRVPVRQALDSLSIEDYDLLVEGLTSLIVPKADAEKKLEEPSDPEEHPTDGSVTN